MSKPPFQIDWSDQKLINGMMFLYKTRKCPYEFKRGQCNYGADCFDSHSLPVRRRPKKNYWDGSRFTYAWNYSSSACTEFGNSTSCLYGKRCRLYHSTKESMYHPLNYKTNPCDDSQFTQTGICSRGVICWQYHNNTDRRDMVYPSCVPNNLTAAGLLKRMVPPQQFTQYLDYMRQQPKSIDSIPTPEPQPEPQIQPKVQQTSFDDHFDDYNYPYNNEILFDISDVQNDDKLNDTKQILNLLNKIQSQIIQHDCILNEIKEFIINGYNKTNDNEKSDPVDPVNKNQVLIDGYLRSLFEESESHYNTEISTLVAYFWPEMTELVAALKDKQNIKNPSENENVSDNDIDIWRRIKKKHMNEKILDVENESEYLMIQNGSIDIRNKSPVQIKEYILEFLVQIGCNSDEISTNNNQFQLRFAAPEYKKHLFAQIRMISEQVVKSTVLKAEQYINQNGLKKWKIGPWRNYQNRNKKVLSKKLNERSAKNRQQNQNQNQNQAQHFNIPPNNISGALPLHVPIILPNTGFPLPNIPPIYYNNPNYNQ